MDLLSSVGSQELLLILLIAVIVIGPAKIVSFGKSLGKFTRNFKDSTAQIADKLTKEVELEEKEKKDPSSEPK